MGEREFGNERKERGDFQREWKYCQEDCGVA